MAKRFVKRDIPAPTPKVEKPVLTPDPTVDSAGRARVVGCRVHVPARVPGDPYTLAEAKAESVSPAVGGRILAIYEGKRGLVADIRGFDKSDYGVRSVPLNLCNVQQGDTQAEKLAKHTAAKEAQ